MIKIGKHSKIIKTKVNIINLVESINSINKFKKKSILEEKKNADKSNNEDQLYYINNQYNHEYDSQEQEFYEEDSLYISKQKRITNFQEYSILENQEEEEDEETILDRKKKQNYLKSEILDKHFIPEYLEIFLNEKKKYGNNIGNLL